MYLMARTGLENLMHSCRFVAVVVELFSKIVDSSETI